MLYLKFHRAIRATTVLTVIMHPIEIKCHSFIHRLKSDHGLSGKQGEGKSLRMVTHLLEAGYFIIYNSITTTVLKSSAILRGGKFSRLNRWD